METDRNFFIRTFYTIDEFTKGRPEMSKRISIEQLKETSIDAFSNTLAYALAVGDEMGKKKALRILGKLIGESKIRWSKEHSRHKGRGDDAVAAFTIEQRYIRANSLPGTYRPDDIQVVQKSSKRVVARHRGFCITLEACKRLRLKTADVCPIISQTSWQTTYKKLVNPKLIMKITKLRPETEYCEETIEVK
jgi:hypothetical protein